MIYILRGWAGLVIDFYFNWVIGVAHADDLKKHIA